MSRSRFHISAGAVLAAALLFFFLDTATLWAIALPVAAHELGHVLALRLAGLRIRSFRAEMKGLCQAAGVAATKVFPHNLRHLFAVTFYRACRDVARLADVLGHSSINTTRVYLISTGREHAEQLNRLGLVR